MSAFQDLWTLLGPKGVPVALGVAAFATFEFLEKISSDEAKAALTKAVRGLAVYSAATLPDGTRDLFQHVFGKRHFSIKCLFRSCLFSLLSIGLLTALVYLSLPWLSGLDWAEQLYARFEGPPDDTTEMPLQHLADLLLWKREVLFITLWVCWSFVPDYMSLYKTRVCLALLSKRVHLNLVILLLLIICDFAVTAIIFHLGLALVRAGAIVVGNAGLTDQFAEWVLAMIMHENVSSAITFRGRVLFSILFYAGLVPSVWLWLYVLSLFVTRVILRSGPVLEWLRWFLPIDKNPFRSVGAVASVLMCAASALVMACLTYA